MSETTSLKRSVRLTPLIFYGLGTILGAGIYDWDPLSDGNLCFKQHGHPTGFGVPKGALIHGEPAPSDDGAEAAPAKQAPANKARRPAKRRLKAKGR